MSKKYELVLCATYATVTKVFTKGVIYTSEQVESVVGDQNDAGEYYFEEVSAEASEADDAQKEVGLGGLLEDGSVGGEVGDDVGGSEVASDTAVIPKVTKGKVTIGKKSASESKVTI